MMIMKTTLIFRSKSVNAEPNIIVDLNGQCIANVLDLVVKSRDPHSNPQPLKSASHANVAIQFIKGEKEIKIYYSDYNINAFA